MKKFILCFFVILLIIITSGCGITEKENLIRENFIENMYIKLDILKDVIESYYGTSQYGEIKYYNF